MVRPGEYDRASQDAEPEDVSEQQTLATLRAAVAIPPEFLPNGMLKMTHLRRLSDRRSVRRIIQGDCKPWLA
jgi:hypothetical protein